MILPVERVAVLLALLPVEMIPTRPGTRAGIEKARALGLELSLAVQLGPRQLQEAALAVGQGLQRLVSVHAQARAHVLVEVLQEHSAGLGHARLNLLVELGLKPIEGRLDFLGIAASLVDLRDAALDVYPGFERAQHLVARAEEAVEELELLAQELEDAPVGLVAAVQEVD